jgi:PDZ domain-containing secreted protein
MIVSKNPKSIFFCTSYCIIYLLKPNIMKKIILLIVLICTIQHLQSQQAYLGITSNTLHPQKAEKLSLPPFGVYITSVVPNTSAEKAGLQPFDYIYQIGDEKIDKDNDLHDALNAFEPNDQTSIYYIRNQQKTVSNLTFGNRKNQNNYRKKSTEDPFLGVHDTHDDAMKGVDGVKVNIGEGSTADLIGMKNGDVVTFIDDYPILDWHDLRAGINNRNVGDPIEVTVFRNENFQTFVGRIKSEAGHSELDKQIDLEYMEVKVLPMPEEEMETAEQLNIIEEEEMEMEEMNPLDISVFPNPNIGQFTLEAEISDESPLFYQLFDSQGKQVISETIPPSATRISKNFDLGNNPAGVYYLKVIQNDQIMTRKIIIARS